MGGAGKSSEGRQNAPTSEKPAGDDSARTEAGAGEPHKKKIAAVLTITALGVSLLVGCGGKKQRSLYFLPGRECFLRKF